jgi:hypothetical protein
MKVNITQAGEMVKLFLKAGLVPRLHSSPGIGKSDIIKGIAEKYKLKLIDIRLSQCDPTDLVGLIQFKGNKCSYAPMDVFPLESDPVPEGYSGWLIFFDEITSAPRSIQSSAYKIILDRMIGQYHLNEKVFMVAAGNLETDNAVVESMSTALQSRMVHLEVNIHLDSWLDYAYENGIHYMITSFLQFQPNNLYTFNPDHSDKTYACPRTWFMANKVLQVTTDTKMLLPMLAGTVGEGVAREFISFMEIEKDLPKFSTIVNNPKGCPVPDEPSVLFALSGSIAEHVSNDTVGEVLEYVGRIPMEHQVVCIRKMVKKDKSLMNNKATVAWITKNKHVLF